MGLPKVEEREMERNYLAEYSDYNIKNVSKDIGLPIPITMIYK